MISASQAQELTGYQKAIEYINKNIKKAASNGESTYTYTTDMKTKASAIVKALKELGFSVRFVHTPKAQREHKVVVNW